MPTGRQLLHLSLLWLADTFVRFNIWHLLQKARLGLIVVDKQGTDG